MAKKRGRKSKRLYFTEDTEQAIVEYLATEFKKDNGIDLKTDKLALQRLKEASEKADSKEWPLRIAVNVENNGKFNYLMGFDQSKEEDLR